MKLEGLKYVYFIGVGGIGMSALARYFHHHKIKVKGYDKTNTSLTQKLQAEGIKVHFDENIEDIGKPDFVVYTPAVPKNNKELIHCQTNGFSLKKRSEVLGEISESATTIAIAGTHGKTTITSLLSHLFKQANFNVAGFLGGIATNYNSNLVLSPKTEIQVMEADEFDKSFLKLKPAITGVTSVDADHLDIYKEGNKLLESYQEFAALASEQVFVKKEIQSQIQDGALSYSIKDPSADFFGKEISIVNGQYHFELVTPNDTITKLRLGLPGRHNVENAVLAAAIFLTKGGNVAQLKEGLASFQGIKRRFEKQFQGKSRVYIDDYAHHPTEIEALLESVKEMYPKLKICGFFQPHLFSRTRDFGDAFAIVLSQLDEVNLLPIYPAREEPIEGINSQWLLNKIDSPKKALISPSSLPKVALSSTCKVFLTIGAGDIDKQVDRLKTELIEAYV